MSPFTWMNSALRNRQQVGTLADMVQVRQWELHQLEEKPRTHPTVRWVDKQEVIRGRQKTVRESIVNKDGSGDELDIDDEDDTKEVDLIAARMEDLTLDEDIDPNSPFLTDLLSDRPQTDLPARQTASIVFSTERTASDASVVVNWNW
ncbi:uncharacterized protein PHACADRAFT_189741 [Phanerochaete carnosa HHB-10118-sp]|uniref:Uncharacterized protein n=1 Tax=Phanerochaete carnosa (strain HHB-10118-sp) TaxID=650164 RepID=K5XC97_PHACS|nr:uncharacterized protein PHACADRAFT_189741 [Phanerochaete carnosa HHB-10118-sp]EKM60617.1 hypothetical protein PHACADRAFT_189741 [Phanerochaete carnosa HHB-10118-sp]